MNDKTYDLFINDLLKLTQLPHNRVCADCGSKSPRWCSWNLGIFICMKCAGLHRKLGVAISKVKSITLDKWTPEQVRFVKEIGNKKSNDYYAFTLPSAFIPPKNDFEYESFIFNKYQNKIYANKNQISPSQQLDTNKNQISSTQQLDTNKNQISSTQQLNTNNKVDKLISTESQTDALFFYTTYKPNDTNSTLEDIFSHNNGGNKNINSMNFQDSKDLSFNYSNNSQTCVKNDPFSINTSIITTQPEKINKQPDILSHNQANYQSQSSNPFSNNQNDQTNQSIDPFFINQVNNTNKSIDPFSNNFSDLNKNNNLSTGMINVKQQLSSNSFNSQSPTDGSTKNSVKFDPDSQLNMFIETTNRQNSSVSTNNATQKQTNANSPIQSPLNKNKLHENILSLYNKNTNSSISNQNNVPLQHVQNYNSAQLNPNYFSKQLQPNYQLQGNLHHATSSSMFGLSNLSNSNDPQNYNLMSNTTLQGIQKSHSAMNIYDQTTNISINSFNQYNNQNMHNFHQFVDPMLNTNSSNIQIQGDPFQLENQLLDNPNVNQINENSQWYNKSTRLDNIAHLVKEDNQYTLGNVKLSKTNPFLKHLK